MTTPPNHHIMKTSHFQKQCRLTWIAVSAGLTMMLPAFLSFGVREIRYRSAPPDGWSWAFILAEFLLLVLTPFWALSMGRGFLASPRTKRYCDELREDGERVLREKGEVASDNAT